MLQYYAYLNLAVAVVLIYKPPGWEGYRRHGAEDITRSLIRISLSSPVVHVRQGALTLFHSIISAGRLPLGNMTLRDLLVPLPMLSAELEHAFGIRPLLLSVSGDVVLTGEVPNQMAKSCFTYLLWDTSAPAGEPGKAAFPLKRLYNAIPELKTQYSVRQSDARTRIFESKTHWIAGNKERAERFHSEMALKFVNFGGQNVAEQVGLRAKQIQLQSLVQFAWRFQPDSNLLPTLTAGLLLSFTLASLARYRANLLDRVENSKINIIYEVFVNEADGFMIPALRNLLYAETMYVRPVGFT